MKTAREGGARRLRVQGRRQRHYRSIHIVAPQRIAPVGDHRDPMSGQLGRAPAGLLRGVRDYRKLRVRAAAKKRNVNRLADVAATEEGESKRS
jgi:hypothetical protein